MLGYASALGAAASYGGLTVIGRMVVTDHGVTPVVATAVSMVFGLVILTAMFHRHAAEDAATAPRRAWLWVTLAGVSGTWGVGFWYFALSKAPVVLVAPLAGTHPTGLDTCRAPVPPAAGAGHLAYGGGSLHGRRRRGAHHCREGISASLPAGPGPAGADRGRVRGDSRAVGARAQRAGAGAVRLHVERALRLQALEAAAAKAARRQLAPAGGARRRERRRGGHRRRLGRGDEDRVPQPPVGHRAVRGGCDRRRRHRPRHRRHGGEAHRAAQLAALRPSHRAVQPVPIRRRCRRDLRLRQLHRGPRRWRRGLLLRLLLGEPPGERHVRGTAAARRLGALHRGRTRESAHASGGGHRTGRHSRRLRPGVAYL